MRLASPGLIGKTREADGFGRFGGYVDVRGGGAVLIAEDDDHLRALLTEALRSAGYEVEEAATGPEAIACAGRSDPDLALLDVVLPGISGYEVFRQLRERFGEELPIMFMSGERVEAYDRMAGLALGAEDYIMKPFEVEELLALIRKRTRQTTKGPRRARASELTERQLDVLNLLAEGLDQNEIASRLVISPKTVGAHVEHIFAKLGVHSRAQAVAHAYREHLLEGT
jgi:DNA-binding NarL/FixJ family response regulator